MTAVTRPRIAVECAFGTTPFVALTDENLAWADISGYVELQKGLSIQRRRQNELDEPSPGTLSLWLDNTDGRFTRLNTSGPYYPNVKHNRLIRVRALWPDSVNLLAINPATGGGDLATTAGTSVPTGTLTALLGSATANATGTTSTLKCPDADATDVEVGDIARLYTAAGALKERTFFRVTGESSSTGTTTLTFSPNAAAATASGDVLKCYRQQWATGLQPATGTRLAVGGTGTTTAGPDATPVTAGTTYTFSVYVARTAATAISVSPRILWYDLNGALLSETTGSTTALTTSLQRLSVTAAAPANAALARVAVANETVLAGSPSIAFRNIGVAATQLSNLINITIPSSVQAGDGLLLWITRSDTNAVTTPSGWTLVGSNTHGAGSTQGKTWLYESVATSSGSTTAPGKTFAVTATGSYDRMIAILGAWSGTDPAGCVHQSASAIETAGTPSLTHTTPNVTTSVANCWIVSSCCDVSSTSSAWTSPDTERAEVFCTGSLAATGAVADNATAVAIGTYGTKVFTSNVASDSAAMWTVALKPNPASGGSTATIQTTGWQLEAAGSASTWAEPSRSYTRFVGHVDRWPTQWEGGFWPITQVTATDRMKLLADDTVRAALTEQILSGSPLAYYPLNEESGATAAGNAAEVAQPSLPVQSVGAATDDMIKFGGGTGPGTDAQQALKLSPGSSSNPAIGKALRGNLTTPMGGDGVTGMTIAACIANTATNNNTRVFTGCDDGRTTDSGAIALFDMGHNPATPITNCHLRMPGGLDVQATTANGYNDGATHMVVATAVLSGGQLTLKLYVDAVLKNTATQATSRTEFAELKRWNIGCAAWDNLNLLYSGTLSHCVGWNRALSASEITDLWDAASDGFTGDLPGIRAARIAAWKGLTATSFEAGTDTLGSHPSTETPILDAYKLIATSEGGLFFVSGDGYSTFHGRSHRTNALSLWSVTADRVEGSLGWDEDPLLIANDVPVKRGETVIRAVDTITQVDYGVKTVPTIETILETDAQATARATAYLARYREPISRPGEVVIEALTQTDQFTNLLATEYGQKFTITSLPTGAPAAAVDLFIEGVGEEINADSWKFSLDCSPAGFDFGLILDDASRGLLDSNYVGW